MGRNEQVDAGRKGAPSMTKASEGYQNDPPDDKGDWLPAYTGGMGVEASMVPDSDGDTDGD